MQNIEFKSNDSEIITIKPTDIIGTILEFRNKELVTNDRLSKDFEELKRNIKEAGLLVPITLAPHETDKGKYNIVDGRRRLAASVQLGHKEIRANILEGQSELDLVLIAINLNRHRLNLIESETLGVILKAFTKGGYEFPRDLEHVKQEAHKIHNKFKAEAKFNKVFDRLGITAGYVYLMLKWKTDLSPEVFEKVIEENINVDLRNQLAKYPLNKNPDVQLQVLNAIIIAEHLGIARGDTLVQIRKDQDKIIDAYISDALKIQNRKNPNATIEWKSIKSVEQDRYTKSKQTPKTFQEIKIDPQEQPKVSKLIKELEERPQAIPKKKKEERPQPEIERTARLKLQDMREAMNKFLIESTGSDKVFEDPDKAIKHTEYYRKEIVDSMIEQDAYLLMKHLLAVSEVAQSFVDLIVKRYPPSTMMYGKK